MHHIKLARENTSPYLFQVSGIYISQKRYFRLVVVAEEGVEEVPFYKITK